MLVSLRLAGKTRYNMSPTPKLRMAHGKLQTFLRPSTAPTIPPTMMLTMMLAARSRAATGKVQEFWKANMERSQFRASSPPGKQAARDAALKSGNACPAVENHGVKRSCNEVTGGNGPHDGHFS